MMSPPQVDPPGPGDGSGSATARTAAAGVAALGEASASGVAARRATTLATAPADGRWQQPQLPQQRWPPPEDATAGVALDRRLASPSELAAREEKVDFLPARSLLFTWHGFVSHCAPIGAYCVEI